MTHTDWVATLIWFLDIKRKSENKLLNCVERKIIYAYIKYEVLEVLGSHWATISSFWLFGALWLLTLVFSQCAQCEYLWCATFRWQRDEQDNSRNRFSTKAMAFVESHTKTWWLSLKALRRQVGFRGKLYKSRMSFIESSTKAWWLSLRALRKQDGFRWKLYESRMAFVESSTKARWLS